MFPTTVRGVLKQLPWYALAFALLLVPAVAFSAANEWTWMHGPDASYLNPCYGTKGVPAPENTPGDREGAVSWTDLNGDFWLYGGQGFADRTSDSSGGWLSDLWKYNKSTNEWTWINGSSGTGESPVFGIQGQPGEINTPGRRWRSLGWTDSVGNLWLFGGDGQGQRNDLWKYDPMTNQWTWEKGSQAGGQIGIYGTKGLEAPENCPGSRASAVGWTGTSGTLWLFGGNGSSASYNGGLNDLWKYDIASGNWTWMHGSNSIGQLGVYGTKKDFAPENGPGSRSESVSWTGNDGSFWLFGGVGTSGTSAQGPLNDLWRYDPNSNQWAWFHGSTAPGELGVYGAQGAISQYNTPGARLKAAAVKDQDGNLYMFGGSAYGSTVSTFDWEINDLWKYDVGAEAWVWLSGSNVVRSAGFYGALGTANPENFPEARYRPVCWFEDDEIWVFGGLGLKQHLNDLWKFDLETGQWTWVKGHQPINRFGNYGTINQARPENIPGIRRDSAYWTDNAGNLWMFGGYGHAASASEDGVTVQALLNDLWKYNRTTNQWNWIKGSKTFNERSVYTSVGAAALGNTPGARENCSFWKDNAGNFWLFGGKGYHKTGGGWLNDMWKFDPIASRWICVTAFDYTRLAGSYGNKGEADPLNIPRARLNGACWTDPQGTLWLFGGDATGTDQSNDLWSFNPTTNLWTWVSGSDVPGQAGNYGFMGQESPTNIPGARSGMASWMDNGSFCFFGGWNFFNDAWKYNTSSGNWIWTSGSSLKSQSGQYGTIGVPAVGNIPGARLDAASWVDSSNRAWIFGGTVLNGTRIGDLNDLWRYNSADNTWAWIAGDDVRFRNGIYGVRGIPAPGNTPGARVPTAHWKDNEGNFWMFGSSSVNDLWKFTPGSLSGIKFEDAVLY